MNSGILDSRGRPVRDLRISVTDRCNFRCPYCMPPESQGHVYTFLPRQEILHFEEIARIARLVVGIGVRKIRLTGGEPLLREGVEALVAQLAAIEGVEDIALTTNGSLLARHTEALRRAGLARVSVSLDSIDDATFRRLNGERHSLASVLEGIEAAERAGFAPLKINAVIVRGENEEDLIRLAERFRGTGHIVRFIEYMDVGTLNDWNLQKVVPAEECVRRIDRVFPIEPLDAGYRGEVARRYRYRDGGGEIGFIASVTRPFCGDCTRLRLSTDGRLYTCLFAAVGRDLKTALRQGADDEALRAMIESTWRIRDDRYSEERTTRTRDPQGSPGRIEMFRIGG